MTRIPFYRPTLPPLQDYVQLLEQIWQSRMLSNFATFCQQLEGLAAQYLKAPHVKAVTSGDIGLIILLKALEMPEGSPCYVSDFTFNSTINAALWAKLCPIIVDIDPSTFNMDPESLLKAVQKRRAPGVILATHVFGNPCDVDSLQKIAKDHGCYLVFDAAHAYGSMKGGIPIGNFGDGEVFSLSGTKLVTSSEGGLIATSHRWLAEKLVYIRAYGFQYDYNSRYVGINGKISELHSALGVLSLCRIEEVVARRHEILGFYQKKLQDNVGWQHVRAEDRSTYKDICIHVGRAREAVQTAFKKDGIETKRYFLPLHFMKPYKEFAENSYPGTEEVYENTICIPAFSDLNEEDLSRICLSTLKGIRKNR